MGGREKVKEVAKNGMIIFQNCKIPASNIDTISLPVLIK